MADAIVETKETTPVEKETVTSSVKESPVKESPVKETNGSGAVEKENGSGDAAIPEAEEAPKENGADAEEPKENGDSNTESCGIKRKSCAGEADKPEVPTPEKKAKLAEDDDCAVAEESNDAEAVEA